MFSSVQKFFMKKLIYILILVLAPAALKADKIHRVDSLLKIFEKTQSIVIANQISSELMDEVDPTYSFTEKDKDDYVKGAVYTECSQFMYLYDRYQDAIAYARKGLDYAETRNDEPMISECLTNLSLSYDELKAFELSLKYALRSLEIDKKLGNKYEVAVSYNNIAIFYSNAKQYGNAVESIKKALNIIADFPLQKYAKKISVIYNAAASIYLEIGDLKNSFTMYAKAEELAALSNDKRHLYSYLRSAGDCLLRLGRKEEAERRFNLIVKDLDGNISIIPDNATALFFCLKYFGRYEDALELARREQMVDSLPDILVSMANREKSPEKIKEYMSEAMMWKDSVNMKLISRKNQLIASEIKSAEIEKEATIEKAEEISSSLKFTMTVIICSLLAIIAAITFFGWLNDKKKLAVSNHRLVRVQNRADQLTDALNSLVRNILNDLLSASANISILTHMLAEKSQEDELVTELSSQSDSLRSFLDNTVFWARMQLAGKAQVNKLRVSINDMVDEVIMSCQSSAERKNITLEAKSDMPCVAAFDRNIMSFIIRNIVNNAIKFVDQGGHIYVQFNQSQISIVDNGKGLKPEIVKSLNTGVVPENARQNSNSNLDLGITFIRDLISMMDCRLEIESEEGVGTTFRIIFVKI